MKNQKELINKLLFGKYQIKMTTILKPKSLNIHSKSKIINLDEEEEKSCSPKKSPKKIKQNDPVFFQKKEKS